MKEESIVKEADEYVNVKIPIRIKDYAAHTKRVHAAYITGRSKSIESEKAKDERIKELHTALKDLYVSIVDKEYYRFHSSCLIRVKQLLNK